MQQSLSIRNLVKTHNAHTKIYTLTSKVFYEKRKMCYINLRRSDSKMLTLRYVDLTKADLLESLKGDLLKSHSFPFSQLQDVCWCLHSYVAVHQRLLCTQKNRSLDE